MAKYEKYAEYKDSGVEWLDKAPSHWISIAIKFLAKEKESLFLDGNWIESKDISDSGIRYITTGNVGEGCYKEQGMGYISEDTFNKLSCTEVYPEDILISRLNLPIGRACIVPQLGTRIVTSVDNVIFRPDSNYVKEFLVYLFSSKDYFTHTENVARGATMQRISRGLLGNIRIVVPTQDEQQKICDFLDYETTKIDNLIAKQEKLIELLKEKRQAVISHAVTKGLNPNVTMKDSGVEWLGQVPEHWEVCKIQYYAKIESGHTPSKTNEKYWENCTIPWVSLNDSKQLRVVDYITDTKYQISELGLANSSARILPKETVVFTRDASIGLSAITTREMAVSQHLIAWVPKRKKLSPEFLLLIFYAMEKEFDRYTFGSTIKTIGMDDVSSLMASFPPLIEQLEIVKRCFSQFELIDTSIEKSNRLLNILKERRTALISSAVTGKIDVRNWQNPNHSNNQANTELGA